MTDTQAPTQTVDATPKAAETPKAPEAPVKEDRIARAVAALKAAETAANTDPDKPAEPAKETPPEAPKPEAPPAEEKKDPPAEKPEAKEARISQKIVEMNARESKLNEREAALAERETKAQAYDTLIKSVKDNPSKLLEAAGITFQELADAMIEEAKVPDPLKLGMKKLEGEIQKLRSEKEDEKKAREEEELKRQDEFIKKTTADYRALVSKVVEENKETYELTHAMGAQDFVFEIIEEYWNKNQKILDVKKACELAEKYLESRAEKMLSSKKLQSKKPQAPEQKSPQTLTNSAASGAPERNDSGAYLSTEDRVKRAASLLRFTN